MQIDETAVTSRRFGGLWHFLQIAIALVVLTANAYGGWISNGYMAAINAGTPASSPSR